MSEVFLAEDTTLGRKVAIKMLPEHSPGSSTARQRLINEARAAAALDHPNICAIHEVGEEDDCVFIVMPYIDGENLAERMRQCRLSDLSPFVGRGFAEGACDVLRMSILSYAPSRLRSGLEDLRVLRPSSTSLITATIDCMLCPYKGVGDSLHAIRKTRAEARSNLVRVCVGVLAREDNSLGDPSAPVRDGLKHPLKRQDGSVERHVDDEGSAGANVADLPAHRLLSGKRRGSPRAVCEWALELKVGGRIIPVVEVGSPVPRERRRDCSFH
jgi:hypothetical protein